MTASTDKLAALHDRLHAEQRRRLLAAAEVDVLPPAGMLSKIADIENAMAAVDVLAGKGQRPDHPQPVRSAPQQQPRANDTAMGSVKWFNGLKGFGFIRPDAGGPDAFVHISAVERAGWSTLMTGQRVSYELVDHKSGKQVASNLKAAE